MKVNSAFIRSVSQQDGQYIWQAAIDSGNLDVNSAYCYIMFCKYFSETCRIAEIDGKVVGFVTAFIQPTNPENLFVWQIAVNAEHRGKGIAESLLRDLISVKSCAKVRYIETTISPSNAASIQLFSKFAQDLHASIVRKDGFPSSLFPDNKHEDEQLVIIGPIPKIKKVC
ncbi:diaminobutyrate acetyltransferase [Paenibacillus sp. CGMCC 1.16610]|uniref:L-2,4-diaminobutyric acid acetyltransferase n=1 Tax=Paenibacillus anseongense TaxID=2682845 RepID=A0ABW9ULR6_9BACL|nr:MULTISPECIES: diaminobutyrate acetyltransferase [Paenibacillus]MBA2939800.1 diaminobutyrate acetyltransferase [Paenibacillus sp. CGMCC 1.16610]MVQ39460.1 diaminobutyrate acetyltransferase [Paenibacillus anseongense]